ncbi:hypothetical protein SteCoe_3276 [Stentor coeruleus]|uniref:Phosphodiesterase n=1 Tax=Stentor coeruleus TaxID=5963 RepID=A0A1R2CXK5_9CILI|nr:hypothetical protein SteCoe_3276 [Stentor coeruleus]
MFEFTRSLSKGLPSSSPGEYLLRIVKETQVLFQSQNVSNVMISDYLRKSLRSFTGASWVEVFFVEESNLLLYKTLQTTKAIPVNEDSLPGYVALSKEPQTVNNASASSFYNSFKVQFHPYVVPAKEIVQASSVACVPITKDGQCRLVLLLFNKLDENSSLCYFSEGDLCMTEALGLWAINHYDIHTYCSDLKKKLNNVKEQVEESTKLMSLGVRAIHRRNSLEKCIKVIQSEFKLTKNSIQQISQVMLCEGVIFHLFIGEVLKPIIALGMDTYDSKVLTTKTAEYSLISSKQILNISELSTEPLWDQEMQMRMKSLLACPIFSPEKEPLGCIEYFRKSTSFSPVDETFASKISEILSSLPRDNFVSSIGDKNTSDRTVGTLFKELNSFAISSHELYDYPRIFAEIRRVINNFLIVDSCAVYFANQISNVFWTQQSENCDELTQPICKDTLFGYVFFKQARVTLPDNVPVSDLSSYDKIGMIQPIISNLTLQPVIGLISVFRPHKEFSQEEQEIIEKISGKVAGLLECLWIYRNEEMHLNTQQTEETQDASPEIRFRIANSRRPHTSIHFLPEEVSELLKSSVSPQIVRSNSIYSLTSVSPTKLGEIKNMLQEMKAKPESALNILSKRLRTLVPSQASKLFIMDPHEQHLIDIANSSLAKPSGLVNLCMQTKEIICIRSGTYQHPQFDKLIDSLGGDSKVQSFLAMPIIVQDRSLGVIAFANASINFGPEELAIAEFVSIIPKDYLSNTNDNIKDIRDAIQVGRRHKMLQQWCKQVFFVANSTLNKILLVKDIMHKLYEAKNFEKLIKSGLEMLCAVINTEQAAVTYEDAGEFIEYLYKKGKIIKKSHLEDQGLLAKSLESGRPVTLESMFGKENIIVIPFVEKKMPRLLIKAYNKRDDTLSYYCSFNKEDEQILNEFATAMSISFVAHDKGESPDSLRQFIKQYASNLNNHALISTIRTASQKLLDCDRATVFIIEGKEMVVKSQGLEKEIPVDFRIPIGKGIIGNVAQTGQTENIRDVYEDPRFDPAMDKKTGYRTSTMLCMPVLDTQGKVIAALQMINKKKGFFDESDEETLVIFCEIISSALQNCSMFMHNITERSRILNILNSIGNYILVFNSEGILDYSNKSIKPLFGITKKIAVKSHYSSWLRENRELVLDITSVMQNPTKRIQKKQQKISSASFKRTRTGPGMTKSLQQSQGSDMYFHYTVASVQTFNKSETVGVVLILEDASALAELSSKLEKMQLEVQSMKSSIYGETSLQKCIQKLGAISKALGDPDTKIHLEDVIKTLKQGNLNTADIMSQMPTVQGYSNKAISEYIGLDTSIHHETFRTEELPRRGSRIMVEVIETSILTDLRDIDLDPFIIEDHFPYIKAMFQDFDLLSQMEINSDSLMNFSKLVKEHYGVWDNPFHNFYHGFNVLHATYMLLSSTQAGTFFSANEIFALFIAAFCHDLEHPGRNNTFEINRGSHLALIYNDKSVLENHHSAVTFKILQNEKCNLIEKFNVDAKKSFRKLVVASILGTDMAKHVEEITTMSSRFKDIEETPLKNSDLEGLACILIHSADLSHPCKKYDQYQKWSKKVCDEFTLQFQEEISLGLPPTEIMKDLDRPEVYYASEFGFLKFVIRPLWDCLNLWLNPHINQYIENLNENIEKYQKLKEIHPKPS